MSGEQSMYANKRPRTGEHSESDECSGFGWKMCCDKGLEDRIAFKEHAVERAESHVARLCKLLCKYAKDDDSPGAEVLQNWIDYVNHIKKTHREFEVLVGVAGQTGAGKTSLLNALLGVYELLPSGHEQAATAVSCKVSWNFDATQGRENRAVIYFQSFDDVKNQITLLLKAIVTLETINQTPYEDENERTNDRAAAALEVREGMNKILAVWPSEEKKIKDIALGCKKESDYAATAEEVLRSNGAVVELLNSEIRTVYNSNAEELGKHIKPYLDSTTAKHGQGEEFAAWPLIRNVEIFLQSDILRTGICLVDLPGAGDNVESRAQVAEDYMEKLEVTMIVAAIQRAYNEKTTQKLMNDHQEMRLQLNAGYNQRSYGVILSKMDDIDVGAYIKGNKDAATDPNVQCHQGIIAEANNQIHNISQKRKTQEKMIKKARNSIKKVKKDLNNTTVASSARLKNSLHVAETELKDGESTLQELSESQTVQDDLIEKSKTQLTHWVINKRNSIVGARMQEEFRRRQSQLAQSQGGMSDADQSLSTLDVLFCSSRAFWDIRNRTKGSLAFPTEVYTGVPQVLQWIHAATAERREEHLNCILEGYSNAIVGLDRWSKTEKSDMPIELDPNQVQNALQKDNQSLREALQNEFRSFHQVVSKINPFDKPAAPKKSFKALAKKIANSWSLKFPDDETTADRLVWNSYLAIVRRQGGPYISPSLPEVEYNWIPKLVRPMISVMAADWNKKIHLELPGMWAPHKEAVHKIIEDYFNKIVATAGGFEPSLPPYFASIKTPVLGVETEIDTKVEKTLSTFRKNLDAIRPAIESTTENMTKAFASAEDIKGPGSYARRREILEKHVERCSPRYFDSAWTAMKAELDEKKKEARDHLEKVAEEAAHSTNVHVSLLVSKLLGDSGSPNNFTVQTRVQAVLDEWRKEWQFPSDYDGHVLMRDMAIPVQLREEDLAAFVKLEDSDSDSDSDSEDDRPLAEERMKEVHVKNEPPGDPF